MWKTPATFKSIAMVLTLSGCTAAGDYISGSSITRDPALQYPPALESLEIGTTTKEEVLRIFETPTDLQVSSGNGGPHEAWAYAWANPVIHPIQYVPVFGAWAFREPDPMDSFSVSFSDRGVVAGVSLEKVEPYGESHPYSIRVQPGTKIPPYGSKNPLARNLSDPESQKTPFDMSKADQEIVNP